MNHIDENLLNQINSHPDYKLLKRVPEAFTNPVHAPDKVFKAAIIDLETMGMDAKSDEIIEIGLLTFGFSNDAGIVDVIDVYNELNEPGKPIPEEITKITGITNEDVKGKAIDWEKVGQILSQTHLIICHNSKFDRNFLELQTPLEIKKIVETKAFGCTLKDVDWIMRGYESAKLEYLNFKFGFFYDGHRAITDCWATMNLLLHEKGAFEELKENVRAKEVLMCAVNAPFDKKDSLKERGYRWSDGTSNLPKCWWVTVNSSEYESELTWLDEEIYQQPGRALQIPTKQINARYRYSFRAEVIE